MNSWMPRRWTRVCGRLIARTKAGAMSRISMSLKFSGVGMPRRRARKAVCMSGCSGKYPCDPQAELYSPPAHPICSIGRANRFHKIFVQLTEEACELPLHQPFGLTDAKSADL